ncbi:ESCRT-II complex subunit-domain-containing protein [Dactylonectria estremocensis]|uniref:ESCRT-II complex subunit VPS25 n=1 Tax=Dactylonectria estremocensis TaxID=1079267 RepID=A0A9P9F966_9HYPO|nr:ESCRT-II complex subunit-domain-containing protein [Dactylonectria estremocensis]
MTTPSASASALSSTASDPSPASAGFSFPREYHFPAFYTRQTNLATLHAQRTKWSALILAYARHYRVFRLALSSAADSDLFCNRRLDRRLGADDIRDVVDFMRKDGRAEYVGGGNSGDVVYLYWRKPDEWAGLVETYVEESGQKGSVLTVYELVEGDGTKGTDIHGMDTEILLKALNVLVKRGKAQIFGEDDSLGVKFF